MARTTTVIPQDSQKAPSALRIFFGIPIDEDQAEVFRRRILKENPVLEHRVRWTRIGNHHITVRFLGSVSRQKIPRLIERVGEAIKDLAPFNVMLRHITAFPTRHGKLVAVNIQPSVELQSLYDTVDRVVVGESFSPETHPYLPHITMFRLNDKKLLEFNPISLVDESLEVKTFILYQSIQTEKGSLYTPLHKFFL